MRQIPTLASVLVLLWASSVTLRTPGRELTWAIPACVIAQCSFALIGWWGLQRGDEEHRNYLIFFSVGFFCVLLTALFAAMRFLAIFPALVGFCVIAGGVLSATMAAVVVYWRLFHIYNGEIPAVAIILPVQAIVLTFCGYCTLLSLFAEQRPALRISATALGLFWFLMGVFFFSYCIGFLRMHTVWDRLNQYVPMALTILAFGCLAFYLSRLQAETERETVLQQIQIQTEVAQ